APVSPSPWFRNTHTTLPHDTTTRSPRRRQTRCSAHPPRVLETPPAALETRAPELFSIQTPGVDLQLRPREFVHADRLEKTRQLAAIASSLSQDPYRLYFQKLLHLQIWDQIRP